MKYECQKRATRVRDQDNAVQIQILALSSSQRPIFSLEPSHGPAASFNLKLESLFSQKNFNTNTQVN